MSTYLLACPISGTNNLFVFLQGNANSFSMQQVERLYTEKTKSFAKDYIPLTNFVLKLITYCMFILLHSYILTTNY